MLISPLKLAVSRNFKPPTTRNTDEMAPEASTIGLDSKKNGMDNGIWLYKRRLIQESPDSYNTPLPIVWKRFGKVLLLYGPQMRVRVDVVPLANCKLKKSRLSPAMIRVGLPRSLKRHST